ncbi:MAG: sulfatase-like hydrolase/transferase [Verrucomicrobiales bacterium]|nr:sulfatase-like hydrolase/transferase [Verrucomicrobiales bacterium]
MLSRRGSFFSLLIHLLPIVFGTFSGLAAPNLLLITVDDMSRDSLGSFGAQIAETSPHIDQLASESLCFDLAHVQVGNCFPSRNVIWSGRYPHNTGVEGFYQVKPIPFPVLCDIMQGAGYWVGIRGKVSHSTPYQPYHWDADLTLKPGGGKEHIKDAPSYFRSTLRGIQMAKEAGKPFCLNINISDPHKPFWKPNDPHPASKVFTADEVPLPGFLPDDPAIRKELALYYTSVRRADDCVGEILKALEESGHREDTVIFFLSDHGMPLPFAKTQLYHHSSVTPLIVKWPGVTEAGKRDGDHMVSAVDFIPTLCDIVGAPQPDALDGRSFAPLLKGQAQKGRDAIFKVYNENSAGTRQPIRGVETKQYLYLFNPWSDGKNEFRTATHGTATWKRMLAMGKEDPAIQARVDLMLYRVPEELYDIQADPDCLTNLIDSPEHAEALDDHRERLARFMRESGDPLLEVFELREDADARATYMEKIMQEAADRRQKNRSKKREAKKKENTKKAA